MAGVRPRDTNVHPWQVGHTVRVSVGVRRVLGRQAKAVAETVSWRALWASVGS